MSIKDVGVPHSAHPGPFYLLLDENRVRVVDLDTGAASTLPFDGFRRRVEFSYEGSYSLGRVASTGQHKVLRVVSSYNYLVNRRIEQHCHVFTLGDDCWRPVASAFLCVKFHIALDRIVAHTVVIQGVVYFLLLRKYPSSDILSADNFMIEKNYVLAFDLETEEWRPAPLAGPPALDNTDGDCELNLAKLNGNLVMLRQSHDFHDYPMVEIDLWFATDLEKGVWVKEHSIRLELPMAEPWMYAPDVQLLRVLDDGRVVFYYTGNCSSQNWNQSNPDWRTRIYDPRTNTYTDVPQHGVRHIAGMYRGSMLCLESQ
jgi:F-box interacting protein